MQGGSGDGGKRLAQGARAERWSKQEHTSVRRAPLPCASFYSAQQTLQSEPNGYDGHLHHYKSELDTNIGLSCCKCRHPPSARTEVDLYKQTPGQETALPTEW